MRKLTLVIFLLISVFRAEAQIHEIGVFLGGSNYVGEIGSTNVLSPNQFAWGVLYKWNRSTRYSWRASFVTSEIEGDDANASTNSRRERGFAFRNSVKEFSVGLEFNFLDFKLNDFSKPITPYLYSGVSFFIFDEIFFNNGLAVDNGNQNTFAIPIVGGIKWKISQKLILGAELGARYTFTDNLDGSNPSSSLTSFRFGNLNTNDWYFFTGFTLTYTFGKIPCYSCFQ